MFETYKSQRKKRHFKVDIRDVTKSDIEAVANLSIEREIEEYDRVYASIKRYVTSNDNSFMLVAEVSNQIVGFGKVMHFKGVGIEYPGWYLSGLVVGPRYRLGNIGTLLTAKRLEKIKELGREAYYFANASNTVSIELHKKLGFRLVKEPFVFPDVSFHESHGKLYRRTFT